MANQPQKEQQKQKLVETCPICGKSGRKGSITAWIFSGIQPSCQCNSSAGAPAQPSAGPSIQSASNRKAEIPPSAMEPPDDKFLDSRYLIGDFVGAGGMGSVFKAADNKLKKTFAIKILREELAHDKLACARFEQEAKSVSALTHPNIVAVYEYGRSPKGSPYIVMDYVEGESLDKVIERTVYIDVKTVIEIFIQVADAVAHAHKKRVIHRDIKPSNIIIKTQDDGAFVDVKIVDFGIAKVMPEADKTTQGFTQSGEVFGSPYYMSPEQCTGKKLDGRSDIYSIGCVMYEALSSQPPFIGENAIQTILHHLNDSPESLIQRCRSLDLPENLDYVVMRCLEKSSEDRYQSASELKEDLEALRDGKPIKKVQSSKKQRRLKHAVRSGLYAIISLMLICSIVGISYEQMRSNRIASIDNSKWESLDLNGQIYFDKGNYAKARECFESALSLTKTGKLEDSSRYIASLNELIDLTRATGQDSERQLWEQQLATASSDELAHVGPLEKRIDDALAGKFDSKDKEYFEEMVDRANDEASGLTDSDHLELAQRLLDKSTKLASIKVGPESRVMIRCIHNSAYLKHSFGDLTGAEKLYNQALTLERKTMKGDDALLAKTLLMKSRTELQLGNYDVEEIERTLKETLSMYRRLFGPTNENIAEVRYYLALVYRDTGRLEEARTEIETALAIHKNAKVPTVLRIARCYAAQATISKNPDDYAKAIDLLERESQKDYPLLTSTLMQYAGAISNSDPALAVSICQRAYAMSFHLRKRDRDRLQWRILTQSADAHWRLGEIEQAEQQRRQALSAAETAYGANSEPTFDMLFETAKFYDDSRKAKPAEEYYRKALKVAENSETITESRKKDLMFRFNHFISKSAERK